MQRKKVNEAKLIELFNEGYSDIKIGELMNHPRITIYFARKRLNLITRNRKFGENIELTQQEKEVIVGTTLGDGCIRLEHTNARLNCYHSLHQLEYVKYKGEFLKRLGIKISENLKPIFDKRTKKTYEHVNLGIKTNPALNEFYNMFYKDGVKYIPKDCFKYYSPLAMAIHFMDDGYKFENGGYGIATNSFTKQDLEIFTMFLLETYNIYTTIHTQNTIYIKVKSSQQFVDLIKPYIINEMKYKIHNKHLQSK